MGVLGYSVGVCVCVCTSEMHVSCPVRLHVCL